MKRKIRKMLLGTVLSLSILGGSLTAVAAGCLDGDHAFYVACKENDGPATVDSYHKHVDRARNITCSCTTYKQKVKVTQFCPDCKSTLTMYEYTYYHDAE